MRTKHNREIVRSFFEHFSTAERSLLISGEMVKIDDQ